MKREREREREREGFVLSDGVANQYQNIHSRVSLFFFLYLFIYLFCLDLFDIIRNYGSRRWYDIFHFEHKFS